MSDEGDPEWHSDAVEGPGGRSIYRLFRRISNRGFWNYKMGVLLPFLTLRFLLFYVYLKLTAILSNMGIVILGVSEHFMKYKVRPKSF